MGAKDCRVAFPAETSSSGLLTLSTPLVDVARKGPLPGKEGRDSNTIPLDPLTPPASRILRTSCEGSRTELAGADLCFSRIFCPVDKLGGMRR